jgi:hypothetical protein
MNKPITISCLPVTEKQIVLRTRRDAVRHVRCLRSSRMAFANLVLSRIYDADKRPSHQ